MTQAGIGCDLAALRVAWAKNVEKVFDGRHLENPHANPYGCSAAENAGFIPKSSGYILAEMQFLQRAYPGAEW